ncbi:hypothetical protein Tc00.1047053511827.30 [Trypanosoma cruzi]|uniref:Uncharacterized protein n=1 Tax=Trypanosoma cruzi (strain CL Brener) TaxID=353153 RepID=Q4DQB8_TRYCC|nr:hypothetical protein Tc00.1047053511827.30 [Trypanosoma cruzi]EAN94711.1 hypothetical protein Tc00.1047053511827.30 [Trypanosoma cruzi]|eukprot:XP_816562.1 hypothetical protein [Trypanosoma cruzi strain CL Brener]
MRFAMCVCASVLLGRRSSSSKMDDWEKEYEADRRRLAEGKDVIFDVRRNDAAADVFEEKKDVSSHAVPTGGSGTSAMPGFVPASFGPTTKTVEPSRTGDVAPPVAVPCDDDEEEIRKLYAQYGDDDSLPRNRRAMSDEEGDERTQDYKLHDARFSLTCLPPGWNLCGLFGKKLGRRLFFAETVTSPFKGFLASKESLVGCFVTPNCVYLGDVQTGAMIICVDILRLHEMHIFDGLAVGLKTLDGLELFLQLPKHAERLVEILQKISAFWKVNVKVVRSTTDAAKVFKKEMRLVEKKSQAWRLVEDPRTGLRIVNLTGKFVNILSPIASKILHWVGFVNQLSKDWKGSKKAQRRCAWVTATCFFVAREEGLAGDARNIKHCVAMQYMTELYAGPGGELGIVAAAGPPQPPISVTFESEEEKNAVLFIFQECYNYRNGGGSVKVTRVDSVEEKIRFMKAVGEARPQLFLMRPQKELYDFLRGPSGRK